VKPRLHFFNDGRHGPVSGRRWRLHDFRTGYGFAAASAVKFLKSSSSSKTFKKSRTKDENEGGEENEVLISLVPRRQTCFALLSKNLHHDVGRNQRFYQDLREPDEHAVWQNRFR
jgi:hypothetical protein